MTNHKPCTCVANLCEHSASIFQYVLLFKYFEFMNLFYASSYFMIPSQFNDFICKIVLLFKDTYQSTQILTTQT